MEQCPGEVLAVAKRRWHLELADIWKGHDESNHVGRVKVHGVAGGQIVVRQKVRAEQKLCGLFGDFDGYALIEVDEFLDSFCKFLLINGSCNCWTIFERDLVGRPHPIWMVQCKLHVCYPSLGPSSM